MSQDHPWPGIAHDGLRLFSARRLVAMYGTVRAGRLVVAIGAFLQSHFGIVDKVRAFAAELTLTRTMIGVAIYAGHFRDRQELTSQMSVLDRNAAHLSLLHYAQHQSATR